MDDRKVAAAPLRCGAGRLLLGSDELGMQSNGEDVFAGAIVANLFAPAKIGAVAARAGDDVVAARVGLGGHPIHLLASAVVAGQPQIGLRGNFDGSDGAWVVRADGDARICLALHHPQYTESQYTFNTRSGRDPDTC